MTTQSLTEFKNFSSKDYLTWDEKSMRDFLIRMLNKSGAYTDQIFPGSDLSVLIDITAYAFAMMTYIANNNAAEATFADAQFYENINRLSKVLGYNPRGFITSSVECKILIDAVKYAAKFGNVRQTTIRGIPRYTSCQVNNTDTIYSIASGESGSSYQDYQQFTFTVDSIGGTPVVSSSDNPIFLNGRWKLYNRQNVALGNARESITVDTEDLIAYPFIDVYVFDPGSNSYTRFAPVNNLMDYGTDDAVFSMRLNESKLYELTFGDGINGIKLAEGQIIYVIYLISDGDAGKIGVSELDGMGKMVLEIEGLTADEIKIMCFGGISKFDNEYGMFSTVGSLIYSDMMSIENILASTDSIDYESVESIRLNAPNAYRSGQRLVTKLDYEEFVKSNYSSVIRDCVAMNNFQYCAEFQNYLSRYNALNIGLRLYNYRYSDACDHNNVYLWLRSNSGSTTPEFVKRAILNSTYKIKCISAEPIPMDALATVFTPYAGGSWNTSNWDPYCTNKIIILKDQSSLSNNDRVKETVIAKIKEFFAAENQPIGGTVSLQDLYASVLRIDGVKDVYTAYIVSDAEKSTCPGLGFVYWTPMVMKLIGKDSASSGGDKKTVSNSPVKMQNFQYAELRRPEKLSQIVEVRSSGHYISAPEY